MSARKVCATCGEPAQYRLVLSGPDGVVLDDQDLCRGCAECASEAAGLTIGRPR